MIADLYELSPMQQGMLFYAVYAPNSAAYFNQFTCRLSGCPQPDLLRQAWQQLVDRHAVLRTSFHWEKLDKAMQVVHDRATLPWSFSDWRGMSPQVQSQLWREHLELDLKTGFELGRAPLMRCLLSQVEEREYLFSWSHHHLLMDGWCLSLIFEEVLKVYAGLANGRLIKLGSETPYRDYILWRQRQDEGRTSEFWSKYLAGFRTATVLPTLSRLTDEKAAADSRRAMEIPALFCRRIDAWAGRHQITVNTLIEGAWAMLLWRYCGEPEVVFGATVSGRPPDLPGVESMIGVFINTLPVRVHVDATAFLIPWLKSIQAQHAARSPYEYAGLSEIQQWSEVPRGEPLFRSNIIFMNYPFRESLQAGANGLQISEVEILERSDIPLTLQITPGNAWQMELVYDSRWFEADALDRMLGHLLTLLGEFVEDSNRRLPAFPILTGPEKRQILQDFNNTTFPFDKNRTIVHRLQERACASPDGIMVQCENRRLSSRELNRRSNQLARYLRQRFPLQPDDLVIILTRRSERMMQSILAVWKSRAAYVPVDPDYPDSRVRLLIGESRAKLIITEAGMIRPGLEAELHPSMVVCLDRIADELAVEDSSDLNLPVEPGDLAYVLFTSGSTGQPKGVMIEHAGILNHLLAAVDGFELGPESVVVQNASHCFDISVWEFFAAPMAGGRTVIYGDSLVLDPDRFLERVESDGATILEVVPSYLSALLERIDEGSGLFSRLRSLIVTGEPVQPALLERWFRIFPGIPVVNAYGPTEASDNITHYRMNRLPDTPGVPVGKPLRNFHVYVLDAFLNLCPVGIKGEICASGIGVGRGYLNDPQKTRAAFCDDPFRSERGVRMYRTGDVGCFLPDGNLLLFGRKDYQVKIRGHRIELGEVEAALTGLNQIEEAVVVDRHDAGRDAFLCAYVKFKDGASREGGQLARLLADKLPDYMIPSTFVELDRLPLTQNGKIDRRALPAPDLSRVWPDVTYVAPRTAEEEILCAIWTETLGVRKPGVRENFFSLGGDSIISMQIVSRAARAGLRITPSQIFEHQTIAELALVATPATPKAAGPQRVAGSLPLTPIQQRFFSQNKAEQNHYNQALLLEAPADLYPTLLKQVLPHLVGHHDALRLRFRQVEGRWTQEILPSDAEISLQVEDLSGLPPATRTLALHQSIADLHTGLDLANGPLMRVGWFWLGPATPSRLLFVIHHLAVDGVSWRILVEDFQTAYTQLQRGEIVRLPEKTAPYSEWANQLISYVRSGAPVHALDYWLEPLQRGAPLLPVDYVVAPATITVASMAEFSISLGETATRSLLQDTARAYNNQITDVLLAALGLTVAEWTGQPRVLVDLEVHGREYAAGNLDVSRTVGWFTAIFPVLLEVDQHSLAETVKAVKEQLRRAPGSGLDYGLLRYLSEDEAVRSRMANLPAAQLLFNYLGQIDQSVSVASAGRLAPESSGPGRSLKQEIEHLLEVNSFVADGRLHIAWAFSRLVHQEQTIRRLADRYRANLEALIAHCADPASSGFTPSDFRAARLSKNALDALLSRLQSQGLAPAQVEDVFELTPTQQGMLFHSLYQPSSGAYFNQLSCLIDGPLDVNAFREAWRAVIARHAMLRAAFHWEGLSEPLQVIQRNAGLPFRYLDLSGLSASAAADTWRNELELDRARPFDLASPPVMRLALFRMPDQQWRFLWSQHHLLLDGWSSSILLNEVLAIHESIHSGRQIELPPPPPFRAKVRWLQQQDTTAFEKFWRETLLGFNTPTSLLLSLADMQGSRKPGHFASQEILLSAAESSALSILAQQSQITLNTLAQGAWSLLVSRYSGENDIVYGTVVAGRPPELAGSANMIGVLINTVPMRVRLDGLLPLMAWMKQLQAAMAERDRYSDCSLAEIQSWSDVPGGTALFETLLIFENYPVEESLKQAVSRLRISEVEAFEPNNYALTVVVTPSLQLSVKAVYDNGRFDRETIRRLLGHYRSILESILADPNQVSSGVSVLTEAERLQIVSEWNNTTVATPAHRTVVHLFDEQAARHPQRPAVRCGSVEHSYRDVSDCSNRLASHLLSIASIQADDRIAILMPRSGLMLQTILAVWRSGAAYVPLDPAYPPDRIRTILANAQPRILITGSGVLSADLAAVIPIDLPVVRLDQASDLPAAPNCQIRCLPSSLAYVIYTSGSTGKPKGAMVEHRGMLNHILGMIRDLGIDQASVVAQTASHCFDISVWQFLAALISGGVTVICEDDTVAQPHRLVERVDAEGVTVMQLVPSYLVALIDELKDSAGKVFSRLQFLVLIGEILKPASVERWFELFPAIRMMNAYGPTEASDSITHYSMDRSPRLASIPVGRPVQNLHIYIVDRNMNLCPVGVKGEICVAGVGVGRGYLFDPERTAAVFAQDPFSAEAGARLYHTGDIGCYAPDGNILFFGREDFQVKIRGHRIELGEVEIALATLEMVQDAVVVAREEAAGGQYLCAYVVARQGADCGTTDIQQALRQKLPDYMVPPVVVLLHELPLTPNGKVNRKALPAPDTIAGDPNPTPPRTPTERILVGIWEEVLARQDVGIDDRFFDIGGHSLRAIQAVSRIRRDLHVEVTLADFFSLDTIRQLAEHLDLAARRLASAIPTAPLREWYEISHTQKRIWLASRTPEGSAAHHLSSLFELDGSLDSGALRAAFDALIKRHESLRTVFALVGGEPRQKILEPEQAGFRLEELDLSKHASPAAEAQRLTGREAGRAFDLNTGPLFRAKLIRLEDRKRLLLLSMHHIISDAWSLRVLFDDLRTLYGSYLRDGVNPLPALGIQYKDYAAWQNAQLVSDLMNPHREYWLSKLSAPMPRLEMPVDFPRPARLTYSGDSLTSEHDEGLEAAVSALARKHNVSLYVVALSAIYAMLYRTTAQEDIVIGSQLLGRDHYRLEDQIGAYLSAVVLRTRVRGTQSVAMLIGEVNRMLTEALDHQVYPLDLLLEELRVRTPANRSPLFDVYVNYVPNLESGSKTADISDLRITDLSAEGDRSKYDLALLLHESDAGRLQFVINYNSGLFRKKSIGMMLDRLLTIERQFARDDRQTLDDLPLQEEEPGRKARRVHVGLNI